MAGPATSPWTSALEKGRGNAFDAIRLALAALVIFEHAYVLTSGGSWQDEPLNQFTGGQTNSGAFAVWMFFALSGFLVTRSFDQTPQISIFLAKRFARIVPGFLAVAVFGLLVIRPLTSNSIAGFSGSQSWRPILVSIVALKPMPLAGLFPDNPVQGLINGSLWTIRYEFDCYLSIALLGGLKLLRRRCLWYPAIGIALIAGNIFASHIPKADHGLSYLLLSSPDRWPELFSFFYAGSFLYAFRNEIPFSKTAAAVAAAVLLLTAKTGHMYLAIMICGTYALLVAALSFEARTTIAGRHADLSYGTYLYGWPVSQTWIFMTHNVWTAPVLFLASMPVALALAWVSWTFIEAPCLRLVRVERHRTPALQAAAP